MKHLEDQNMTDKGQGSLEKAAIDSITLDKAKGILADLGEILLDDDLKEEVLEQLPILKYRKIYKSIRDAIFFNKFCKFLESLSEVPIDKRKEFASSLSVDEEQKYGNYLVSYIERLDDEAKPEMAGRIFSAFVLGRISREEMLRFNHILERLFILDILELRESVINRRPVDDELALRLAPHGVTSYVIKDDPRMREYLSLLGSGREPRPPMNPFESELVTSFSELGVKFVKTVCGIEDNAS